jgi:hypothetical protein
MMMQRPRGWGVQAFHPTTTTTTTTTTSSSASGAGAAYNSVFVYRKGTATTSTSLTELSLYASVEAAITEAERICAMNPDSDECRVAWDIVEELEAADSHKSSVSPEAVEAAAEVGMDTTALLGSFDILTHKVDTKMDQLMTTADQLHSMGAPGEMQELVRLAQEMKVALRITRDALADL